MKALFSLGGLGFLLYIGYYFVRRSQVDGIVADIATQPTKQQLANAAEIATLEQEIKDGKIDYAASRARLDELRKRTE